MMRFKRLVKFGLKMFFQVCVAAAVWIPGAQASVLQGWDGSLFAGYNLSKGNTEKTAGNLGAEALKKMESSEFKLKGSFTYGETNSNMDTQKWDAMARYARDFGREDRWFHFYQVASDHDFFADIHLRVTPGVGLGYHIAQSLEWTWDADAGLGWRITRRRSNTAADDEALTALAHTFMKKKIFAKAFLSEDLTMYPGLESGGGYDVKSETAFTNSLSENLDLEIKYILDYNSDPAAGKKKTDTQIISGIKYKF